MAHMLLLMMSWHVVSRTSGGDGHTIPARTGIVPAAHALTTAESAAALSAADEDTAGAASWSSGVVWCRCAVRQLASEVPRAHWCDSARAPHCDDQRHRCTFDFESRSVGTARRYDLAFSVPGLDLVHAPFNVPFEGAWLKPSSHFGSDS